MRLCEAQGCAEKHYGRGWCRTHYLQDPAVKLMRRKVYQRCNSKPKSKERRRVAQKIYSHSHKFSWSLAKRWAKKKKKTLKITELEFESFRLAPCTKCHKGLERTGLGFELINPRADVCTDNMLPMCGVCRKIASTKDFDPIDYSKKQLRRYWKRNPNAVLALARAKRDRGWECAECRGIFPKKQTHLDHIAPVVNTGVGFVDLDIWARRLLCDADNLQVLCKPCHKNKTSAEAGERATTRRRRK